MIEFSLLILLLVAMFEFTQTIFNSLEDASQTPISVRLSSGSGELINPVNVVLSLSSGSGSGTSAIGRLPGRVHVRGAGVNISQHY